MMLVPCLFQCGCVCFSSLSSFRECLRPFLRTLIVCLLPSSLLACVFASPRQSHCTFAWRVNPISDPTPTTTSERKTHPHTHNSPTMSSVNMRQRSKSSSRINHPPTWRSHHDVRVRRGGEKILEILRASLPHTTDGSSIESQAPFVSTAFVEMKPFLMVATIWTSRINFLAASLPRIPGLMVLCLFFGFAMSNTMIGPFLITQFGKESACNLSLLNFLLDSLSIKHCPQKQYTIPWFQ